MRPEGASWPLAALPHGGSTKHQPPFCEAASADLRAGVSLGGCRLGEHASATLGALRLLFCERGWLGCRLGRRVSESANLVSLRPLGSLRGCRVFLRAAQVLAPASGRVPASLRALRVCDGRLRPSLAMSRLGSESGSDSDSVGCGRPLRRQ